MGFSVAFYMAMVVTLGNLVPPLKYQLIINESKPTIVWKKKEKRGWLWTYEANPVILFPIFLYLF